jgi:hypothetical protein
VSASFGAVLRWYLAVLLGGLFLQGVGSLIFRLTPALAAAAPYVVRGIFGIDYWHAWIHIVWGAVGCVVLAVQRTRRAAVGLALIFGLFYTALAILGVTIYHPFGLELDWFENTFHLAAGPLTLFLGLWGALHPALEDAAAAPS